MSEMTYRANVARILRELPEAMPINIQPIENISTNGVTSIPTDGFIFILHQPKPMIP